jgi:two-component system chemotaxis response regulator CheB
VTSPVLSVKTPGKPARPYRVLVVDDSAVIRGLIARWLDGELDISVVGTASNGLMALRQVEENKPELVILDIEMPVMDGMTALPKIIELIPDIKVIMASTLTRRNAEISMQALEQGAADYIPKPESTREINSSVPFRQEIVEKVKALGALLRKSRGQPGPQATGAATPQAASARLNSWARPSGTALVLRKPSPVKPRILAIGSSTGGPQALLQVLGDIKNRINVPIIITQHMPATFTAILAEHLTRATGRPCAEARDGDVLDSARMYLAPGNYHMTVEREQNKFVLRINQGPPENFCRPAVDPMFKSVSRCFGSAALGLILTGMGQDGLKGSEELVKNGGTIVAQDEESSVVWGMPGAVALAGLCSAVQPLKNIGQTVLKLADGGGV